MPDAFPRPRAGECPDYYLQYTDAVPDGDVLARLREEGRQTVDLLRGLEAGRWSHRYAEGKWSVAELLGHLVDSERIFATRALAFARGEASDYPGFDEDAYVAAAGFGDRDPNGLLAEFAALREASLQMFSGLPAGAASRRGRANGVEMAAGHVAWILAGHERHHRQVLVERYLG